LSALAGWLTSFLTSVFLEYLFAPQFSLAIDQQVRAGTVYYQMYGWFIASLMYFGWLQAPLIFCYLKSNPNQGS
jgi:hypothetical protein